jgi:reverse gyrase
MGNNCVILAVNERNVTVGKSVVIDATTEALNVVMADFKKKHPGCHITFFLESELESYLKEIQRKRGSVML